MPTLPHVIWGRFCSLYHQPTTLFQRLLVNCCIKLYPMVDLTLFHPDGASANSRFRNMDRLNSWTSFRSCRFLEWTGWYNMGVAQRLLGHYRLFQHFKDSFSKGSYDLPAAQAYILQYQAGHEIKFFLARISSWLERTITPRTYYGTAEIAVFNRRLVSDPTGILHDFLVEADDDFAGALKRAVRRISQPKETPAETTVNIQLNQKEEHHHLHQDHHVHLEQHLRLDHHAHQHNNQFNTVTVTKEGQQGKESGVFSKKQILILFDLLNTGGNFGSINYQNPNKFEAYADLLRAITGKSKQSIKEELHDYRTKSLYTCHTPGEFDQLINILTQLLTYFENAGFESFAKVIDKKIMELKAQKRG
jgi:hypothetical protein